MATEVKVPTLGESVTEATVGEWLKNPGDAVIEKIKLRAEELGYETEPLMFGR